jgi:hypothetical protein
LLFKVDFSMARELHLHIPGTVYHLLYCAALRLNNSILNPLIP